MRRTRMYRQNIKYEYIFSFPEILDIKKYIYYHHGQASTQITI